MPDFTCGCDASRQAEELHNELANRWGVIYNMYNSIDDAVNELNYMNSHSWRRTNVSAVDPASTLLHRALVSLWDARDNAETILKGEGK